ncbi:anthranilate synthase component I [Coprococcus sp. AF102-57]|uniref:anthranilate synthase component I n=1 Tax=Coprococcus sp. AF102-57 TaxID=2997946 RepID=UPI0022E2075B|nr:anthranilate synthase component I [Coprococcus sp. AF102-57]
MMYPDCDEILKMAPDYDIIPVCREIYADVITSITLLRKLAAVSKRYYLLESVEGGEKWGRYSFLGFDPVMRVKCSCGKVTIEKDGEETEKVTDKPLEVLREILKDYKAPRLEGLPPFAGGFVGYFAYAMIGYAEPKLNIKKGTFNDYDMMLFDKVIAYDHLKQKISIIVNMKTDKVMENYGKATAQIQDLANLIRSQQTADIPVSKSKIDFTCNVSKEEYCKLVEKTKEYIVDGDIFQAVISRQFSSPYEGSLINPYRVLRTTNPSPYMVYMKIDDDEIMSTSPETLVRLENGRLTTFPVAGSRPRGLTEEEDQELEADLLSDEKELSEHNMLVDLGRNDLGRISRFDSVEVTKYMMIHKYSKIMHICSQVEGDIKDDCDALSAIESVLPAGTLSGAPKIRACEIIEELESEERGVYGGALGYLDFTGNMDTCIAIRMAVKKDGRVYVQAGGGIVADSIPENEYQESANKAAAVMNAIKAAKEVLE